MARPIKNNADYFSHDRDMRNDPKIKYIRSKYDLEGYAVYCMLLEYISGSDFFEIEYTPMSKILLAGDMGISIELLDAMIGDFILVGLFVREGEKMYSKGLKKRLTQVSEKRDKMREIRNSSNNSLGSTNRVCDAQTQENENLGSTNPVCGAEMRQSKVKESKVNIYPKGYSESEDSQSQDFENKNEGQGSPVQGATQSSRVGETSQSSEDSTITLVLDFLKKEIGVPDFKESKNTQRAQARNIRDLKNEIGEIEFKRRLENLKADKLKFMNCNSIANLFGELKSSRITPIPAPKAPILPAVRITLLDDTIPERDPEESARIKAELDAKVARLKRASPARPNILSMQHA